MYRLLADENVEPATRAYLGKLGHDVEWIGDVPELGLGAKDSRIARYSYDTERILLTEDDDFLHRDDAFGVLYYRDQTLSHREVGDIVNEIARYVDSEDLDVEFVSANWL